MSHKFTMASQRRPEFSGYSDADIQNQYAAADALCARLDDELCARGY